MAPFEKDDPQRLDWNLLLHGSIALYHQPHILSDDCTWLHNHGYIITSFDCSTWHDLDALHTAFATELAFPDYYGRNLAALNDCLSDLTIPDKGGLVLVFSHYNYVAQQMPDVAWHILDIIASQARYFLLYGRHLLALVQSDNPRLHFEPVGACPVSWNGREWLNKDRGL
jgi:RNAse (barnase) inhibitor barstar